MIVSRNIIKQWFRRGLTPLEDQFASWIDSYWHKTDEQIPIDAIENLSALLDGKIDRSDIESVVASVQLERRIPITTERLNNSMLIGEATRLTEVMTVNVSAVNIVVANVTHTIDTSSGAAVLDISIPSGTIVQFNLTRQHTDATMYLFFKGRAVVS